MARVDKNIIIGLTTFNHEFLKLSVSGLFHIGKNITLIIYNDNPCRKLAHRTIRRLGFRGHVHIINTDENLGHFGARLAILEYVRNNKISSPWFMFANDDDIVLNTNIPNIDANNYAVMGNAVVVRGRILDVLRVMENPTDYTVDGTDTYMVAPNVSMAGTFIRTETILSFAEFVSGINHQIRDIISDNPFVVPVDILMWNMLTEYMRVSHPDKTLIYMNQTNYLMTKLNNTRRPTQTQCDGFIARVVAVVMAALRGNE